MSNQKPKLVRLRTSPMPDPGEWCYQERTPAHDALFADIYSCKFLLCEHGGPRYCALGHEPRPMQLRSLARPQSCIDSAEEVET